MTNRIFFLVPGVESAKALLPGLSELGFEESDIHVIADRDIALEPLPEADLRYTSDLVDAARRGALTGGGIGLLGGLVAVTSPVAGLTLGGAAVLATTAAGTVLGTWFSTLIGVSVPNQDVDEYRSRIEAGEIMIIVDADGEQERAVREFMRREYPGIVLQQGNLDAA